MNAVATLAVPSISLEVEGGVAVLTLDRPPLNILTTAVMREMTRELAMLRGSADLRCLLLRGAGKCFCAGVDVGEHEGLSAAVMLEAFHNVFKAMQDLDVPVVAAVQGQALGGGAELATFADIPILAESARLGFPEIRLGVFPPVAAAVLPFRIGAARTRDLLFTGRLVDAREAVAMGLASSRPVPDAELDSVARAVARDLASLSASSLRILRQALRIGEMESFRTTLQEEECLYLGRLMKTEDAKEGLRAFLEKRKPVWRHR